jgi:uncharacterized lipoprotein NlpE involved in copper resistance
MKHYYIIAVVMLMALSGCSNKLNPQDQALLRDTHNMVEKSLAQSAAAMAEAKAARESADRAAAEAKAASTKADRIFRESQKK